MKRNFKNLNHWIAEVREIALGKVYHADSEDEEGNVSWMDKDDIKSIFNKELLFDYFRDGLSPQDAFMEAVSEWENA